MLTKALIISLIHFCLKEGINAQGSRGLNGEDVIINHPATSYNVHTSMSANPTQASGTMDSARQPDVIANSHPIPELIKSFSSQRNSEDLARSARGASIGGFENTGIPSSLVSTSIPAGVGGLAGIAEGMLLGSVVPPPPIGLAGPNQAIDKSLRSDGPGLGVSGEIVNPGGFVGMPADPVYNSLFNTAVINSGGLPLTPTTISSNTVLTNSINNGIISPVYGELAQVGVGNGLANTAAMANNLPNSGFGNALPIPTLSGPVNGFTTTGISPNTAPATLPARSFSGSKSILASLTGIDPASLRTNAKFTVRSSSPISPTGLTVQAENLLMQGNLVVTGKMPFLGSVTVDGVLPDSGTGTVLYECGSGNIGMVSEVNTTPVGMGAINNISLNPVNRVNHFNGGFASASPNILALRNSVF